MPKYGFWVNCLISFPELSNEASRIESGSESPEFYGRNVETLKTEARKQASKQASKLQQQF
jgi:hypothetical protein